MTDYDPTEVLVLVPILNRPHLIEPLARNFAKATPDGALLVFLPDDDDAESLDEAERVVELALGRVGVLTRQKARGWAGKINAAVTGPNTAPGGVVQWFPTFRYVCCAADDIRFHEEWLDRVMAVMGPNPMPRLDTMVVGTRDLLTANVEAGDHSTHFVVDRRYIDDVGGVIDEGPGSFLPEHYRHSYCDNEFIETAKRRGVFAPSRAVLEHLHHLAGKAQYDEVYRVADQAKAADAAIYESRKPLWS